MGVCAPRIARTRKFMKKSFAIVAVTALVGCASLLSACGGSNKNLAALNSTWYSSIGFKDIQPRAVGEENGEKLTYDVKFIAPSEKGGNHTYSVSYAEGGTYTTSFYATAFDTSIFEGSTEASKYKAEYDEAKTQRGGLTLYRYTTTLTIPSVTYTLKTDETPSTTVDGISVVTDCYFTSVAEGLKPVYSKREIRNAVPAVYQVSSLEGIYKLYDRVYEVYYKYSPSSEQTVKEAVTVTTLHADDIEYTAETQKKVETTTAPDSSANSLFDDCELDVAVRACNVGDGATQAISLFTTAFGVSTYSLTGSSTALVLDSKDTENNTALISELTAKLKTAGLYEEKKDNEGNVIGLKTSAVSIQASGGAAQTYWFIAVENANQNTGKSVMVKYSAPLNYGLGTLQYTLKTVDSIFKI